MKQIYYEVDELLKAGMAPKEIMTEKNVKSSTFYLIAHKLGYKREDFKKPKWSICWQYEEEIKRLRSEKQSYKAIGRQLNINYKTLADWCERNGCAETEEEKNQHRENTCGRNTSDHVSEVLREKGYEYLGGYTNNLSEITVKHIACGFVSAMPYRRFVNRVGAIPICNHCVEEARKKREQEEAEAKRLRIAAREQARLEKESKRKAVQICFRVCVSCGSVMLRNSDFCAACNDRARYSRKDARRRARMKLDDFDSDISLPALIRRDGLTCHICGGQCDLNDYVEASTFIAGNNYPSIDHVIPLAKGGTHTWNNVRVAHRICNSTKSDRT